MRALVLSGGAINGAYQVGALKYLINNLNIKYDILCGVSVGALNCAFLSLYSKNQEQEGIANLEKIWKSINNSKIRKHWLPLGPVHGLWENSIYDSQPLIDLVNQTFDINQCRKSGRIVSVSAVNVNTGEYKSFTQEDSNFTQAILASSAYPMGLKPIEINKEKWTDGGVKHIIPLKEAIDLGATDIDLIACSPKNNTKQYEHSDVINFGLRCFDLMTDQNIDADLKMAELYNRLVSAGLEKNKKYLNIKVIRPYTHLDSSPLDFDPVVITNLINQGYQSAQDQYL